MSLTNKGGAEKIQQAEHVPGAHAKKVFDSILVPGNVITTDLSAAPVLVGKDNLLRIRVTATTYLAFASDPALAPVNASVTSSTSPALELFTAGTYVITATGDWIRASASVARLEVIAG